jgi:phage terminase large subunit-like protein
MGAVKERGVPITDERAEAYKTDICRFLEEQYICAETGKLIVLEQWQKELILWPLFYDLDDEGRRKYSLALLGLPKKHGKSTLAAGIGLWFCFASEPHGEVIVAANNLDQASLIVYGKIRQAFMDNPQLKSSARLLKTGIEMKATGTTCRPIAHKYQTAAGVNPTLVIFDELWGFPGREFYDELTESPARQDPLSLIVTYAGYDKDSLLYSLYKDGEKKRDPRMFYLWVHDNLASWVSQEYLDSQKLRLPHNNYIRFHENRWSAGAGQVVTDEDIQRIHAQPWLPQFGAPNDRQLSFIISNDLGLSHDRAARCVGHFDPMDGKVYVDSLRWWQGTKKEHVPINEVEADLITQAQAFKTTSLHIDPWQMEYVIQRLKGMFTVTPFNFNADIVHLSQTLLTLIRTGTLVMYNEPEFDTELRQVLARQTAKGWRIDHQKGKRDDLVIAVGMMCVEAVRMAYSSNFEVPGEREFKAALSGMSGVRQKEF